MTPTPIDTTFTLTALELGMAISTDTQTAGELLAVAAEMVESYSPHAPGTHKRESIIRFAAYLKNAENPGHTDETFGPKALSGIIVNHSSAFRNSGAAMLLTRFKRRRGGKI